MSGLNKYIAKGDGIMEYIARLRNREGFSTNSKESMLLYFTP
jgi:hypothetical protein